MKVGIVKGLNRILNFFNRVYHPKRKYTNEELDKELKRLKNNFWGK